MKRTVLEQIFKIGNVIVFILTEYIVPKRCMRINRKIFSFLMR